MTRKSVFMIYDQQGPKRGHVPDTLKELLLKAYFTNFRRKPTIINHLNRK